MYAHHSNRLISASLQARIVMQKW